MKKKTTIRITTFLLSFIYFFIPVVEQLTYRNYPVEPPYDDWGVLAFPALIYQVARFNGYLGEIIPVLIQLVASLMFGVILYLIVYIVSGLTSSDENT